MVTNYHTRINPIEGDEQKEATERSVSAVERLVSKPDFKGFAENLLEVAADGCDVDAADIQELAVEKGLLKPFYPEKACGEFCKCAEVWESTDFLNENVLCYIKAY